MTSLADVKLFCTYFMNLYQNYNQNIKRVFIDNTRKKFVVIRLQERENKTFDIIDTSQIFHKENDYYSYIKYLKKEIEKNSM